MHRPVGPESAGQTDGETVASVLGSAGLTAALGGLAALKCFVVVGKGILLVEIVGLELVDQTEGTDQTDFSALAILSVLSYPKTEY